VAAGTVADEVGDAGAASALLGFADAVADGSETILVVTYGSGGAAHAFRVEGGEIPVRRTVAGDRDLDFAAAQRRCGAFDSGVPEGGGAYVSVPSYRRTLPQRHRLVAGRCRACGALRFPPEGACTGVRRERGLRRHTALEAGHSGGGDDHLAGRRAAGVRPQQARAGEYASAIVAFDGVESGSVSVPVQVVLAGDDAPGIGDEVVAVPRLLYEQEGVRRYGAKVVPTNERRR